MKDEQIILEAARALEAAKLSFPRASGVRKRIEWVLAQIDKR